jgi:hypothetical protein
MALAAFLVDSGYEEIAAEPRFEPRDMAIIIEAIGTGLALQAALDPGRVRLSLEAEVMARLVRLPGIPGPEPAPRGPSPAG